MRRLGCVTRNCRQGPMPAEASLFSLAHLYTPQVPLPVLISHLHLFLIFSSHDPHGPHSCWLMTTLQMSPVYQIHNWGLSHIKQETGSFILLLHRMGLSIFTFLSDYAQVLMYVCMHACMWRQRTVLGGVTPQAPSSLILDTRFLIGTRSLLIRPGWLASEPEVSSCLCILNAEITDVCCPA